MLELGKRTTRLGRQRVAIMRKVRRVLSFRFTWLRALAHLACWCADTSDDAFLRKRAEAMEALTKIEIEFARLRDKLYIERMADVEKERIGVETGGLFAAAVPFLNSVRCELTNRLSQAHILNCCTSLISLNHDEARSSSWQKRGFEDSKARTIGIVRRASTRYGRGGL
jgi:hypothetical protein